MPYEIADLHRSKLIFLGTSNKKKILEMRALLESRGFQLKTPADFPDLLDVDESGVTFVENARLKAIAQAQARGLWSIGEDSGLCVPALDGRPGVYSARFAGVGASDEMNNELLLKEMERLDGADRAAYYVSTVVLADPEGKVHIETMGECWGRVLRQRRGGGGFGYDPLFEVAEYHATFAEMGPAVKRAISHRSRALRQFLRKLDVV
jgi:XTP/dITP diphosphohydrolase